MENLTLITGSNGGIGLGVAEYLLNNGIRNLACHYRSSNTNISNLLQKFDLRPENHLYRSDLLDEDSVHKMRQDINNNLGVVRNLVNIAGGSTNGVSWKLSLEDFKKVVDMNLTTTFICSKEFIPDMRNAKEGRIINTSSVVASTGVPGASHYCAAKSGIEGFTKSISLELAKSNITANTIALGYFNVGIISHVPKEIQETIKTTIPLKRFGNTNEIGSLVKYLLSKDSNFVTGQTLHINGGQY